MPTFDIKGTMPAQTRYTPPDYMESVPFWMKLAGYDRRGKRTPWGKALGIVNPLGSVAANKIAETVAKKSGASDTRENIQNQFDDTIMASKLFLDLGATALNAFAPGAGTAVSSATNTVLNPVLQDAKMKEEARIVEQAQSQMKPLWGNPDSWRFRAGGKMKYRKYFVGGPVDTGPDMQSAGMDVNALLSGAGNIVGDLSALLSADLGADLSDDAEITRTYDYAEGGGVEYRGQNFPGYNKPVPDRETDKKMKVLVKEGDRIKLVRFGQDGYSDYTKHGDEKRRESFDKRFAGIRKKDGSRAIDDKFSPAYWAKKVLWKDGGMVFRKGGMMYKQEGGLVEVEEEETYDGAPICPETGLACKMGCKANMGCKMMKYADGGLSMLSSIEIADDLQMFAKGGRMKYMDYMDKSLGYSRDEMPQVDSETIGDFLLHFADKVGAKKVDRKIGSLKPTQSEINDEKVKAMLKDKSMDASKIRYIISSDNHILDGHHRWASDLEGGEEKVVTCYQIDLPMRDLVSRANRMKMTTKRDINDKVKKYADGGLSAAKARKMLHDGTAHGRPLTEQQRKYFGYIGYGKKMHGGTDMEVELTTLYDEDDTREDIDMYDKATGEKVGEMRYNERIFSQRDNVAMEVLKDYELYDALGRLTAAAMDKHEEKEEEMEEEFEAMMGGMKRYANGGPVLNRFGQSLMGAASGDENFYKDAFTMLGERVMADDATVVDDVTMKRDDVRPIANIPAQKRAGFQDEAAYPDYFSSEVRVDYTPSPEAYGRYRGQLDSETEAGGVGELTLNDYLALGTSTLGAIAGAVQSSTPPPRWEVPSEFKETMNRLEDLSRQGLTADEQLEYRSLADETFDRDVAAIRSVATRSTPGAVLSALNVAGRNRQGVLRQLAIDDARMRRENLSRYAAVLPTAVQYDRLQFMDAMNEYQNAQAAGLQLLDESLTSINDRLQYAQAYGPGSSYDNLMKILGENQNLTQEQLKTVLISNGMPATQADMILKQWQGG